MFNSALTNLKNQGAKGFTLIELLVVISIIGLLAAIIVVALGSARSKSRDARRIADIHQVVTALELYYSDNAGYPLPATASTTGPTAASGTPAWSTYLKTWPTAPTPQDGGCSAGQNSYTYTQTGSGTGYTLSFCLGAATGGYASGVHTASTTGIQ